MSVMVNKIYVLSILFLFAFGTQLAEADEVESCKSFETKIILESLISKASSFRIYGKIMEPHAYEAIVTIGNRDNVIFGSSNEFSSPQLYEKFGDNWFYFDILVENREQILWPTTLNQRKVTVKNPTSYSKAPSQITNKEFRLRFGSILSLDFRRSKNVRWSINCKPKESSADSGRFGGHIGRRENIQKSGRLPAKPGGLSNGVPRRYSIKKISKAVLVLVPLLGLIFCKIRGRPSFACCLNEDTEHQDNPEDEEGEYEYNDLEILQRQLQRERLERENNSPNGNMMAQGDKEAEEGSIYQSGSHHSSISSIYGGYQNEAGRSGSEENDQGSLGHGSINDRFSDAGDVADANRQELQQC